MMKTAVLLVNIGTPDSPTTSDVKKFITDYLTDRWVIQIPALFRHLLVRCIIAPFRAPKSAKAYRQLWTDKGSPLRIYLNELKTKVQKRVKSDVYVAMRHGTPNMTTVIAEMRAGGYEQVTVVPLFPTYSESTTETIKRKTLRECARWPKPPTIRFVHHYWFLSSFTRYWSRQLAEKAGNYDHIIFSFHGLPLSHLPKRCRNKPTGELCCTVSPVNEALFTMPYACYRASCYEQAAQIIKRAGISADRYEVCFQSRMNKGWLHPFTDERLKTIASEYPRVLIITPSFTSDCLETLVELDIEGRNIFIANGGKTLDRLPCLNANDGWADIIAQMIDDSL